MQKSILHIVLFTFGLSSAWAQGSLYNFGESITIKKGTQLYLTDDYVNESRTNGVATFNGELLNEGEIHLQGDFENNTDGQVFYTGASSHVIFEGTSEQSITGDSIYFHSLIIDNTSQVSCSAVLTIEDSLEMMTGIMNITDNIDLGTAAILVNESNTSYVTGSGDITATQRTGNTSNIAGLGIDISGSTGAITMTRSHEEVTAGEGSILRSFQLENINTADMTVSLYTPSHLLNGINTNNLALYTSDNATRWRKSVSTIGSSFVSSTLADFKTGYITLSRENCITPPLVSITPTNPAFCTGYDVDLSNDLVTDELIWSTNEFTSSITTNTVGEVTLTGISLDGCVDSTKVNVVENPTPQANFTPSVVSICEGIAVNYSNTSTINSGTLSAAWDFDDTQTSTAISPSHIHIGYGLMNVQLISTSDKGCRDTATQTIRIHPTPVVDFSSSTACTTQDILFTANTSVASPIDGVNYAITDETWIDSDNNETAGSTWTTSFDEADEYAIGLRATTSAGCLTAINKNITVNPVPVAAFQAEGVCAGEDFTIQNNSVDADGYTWKVADTIYSTEAFPLFTSSEAGLLSVALIVTTDEGCRDTTSNTLEAFAVPTLFFGDTIATCVNSMNLNPENTGNAFLWTTGATTPTLQVNSDGEYGLQITSPEGCIGGDTTFVMLNTIREVWTEENISSCNPIILDAFQYQNTYVWQDASTEANLYVDASGTYSVQRSDDYGCVVNDTIEVTIFNSSSEKWDDTTKVCTGDDVVLTNPITTGTHLWSTGSTTVGEISVTTDGLYWVNVTDGACTFQDTTQVIFYAYPTVNLGNDITACDETTIPPVSLIADTQVWSTNEVSASIVVNSSGEYQLTGTNAGVCTTTDTILVTIVSTPVSSLPSTAIACENGTIALNAGSADEYAWLFTDFINSADNVGATNEVLLTDTDTVIVTLTNGGLCSTTDTSIATFIDEPVPDLGNDTTICDLDPFALSQDFVLDMQWFDESGVLSTENELPITTTGTYWVRVFEEGVCEAFDTINITVVEDIVADFASASLAAVNDTIQFVQVASPPPSAYTWQFGDGTLATDEHPIHQYFTAGEKEVQLIVYMGTCSDTVQKTVSIYPTGDVPIDIYFDSIPVLEVLKALVYPNPFETEVTAEVELSLEDDIHLHLFDVQGIQRFQASYQTISLSETLDFSTLEAGTYTMFVLAGKEVRILKLVKL